MGELNERSKKFIKLTKSLKWANRADLCEMLGMKREYYKTLAAYMMKTPRNVSKSVITSIETKYGFDFDKTSVEDMAQIIQPMLRMPQSATDQNVGMGILEIIYQRQEHILNELKEIRTMLEKDVN